MKTMAISLALLAVLLPLVAASCNIDSASLKSHSTSDGLVVTKVGIVATFRLGCSPGTPEPTLHAESDTGKYLTVAASNQNKELKEVSFIEDISESKARWAEIKVYDDETYQKLLQARRSGSSEGSHKPLKTIVHALYSVESGPYVKTETLAAVGFVAVFFFAHSFRSKIVN